jgi:ribosomal protein S12 methylthiotransferase accessory factor
VRPHFAALGITRIARLTGLDRLGIPCFAALRPNSRSIASNQGKGVDDDSARASAVMEAVEFAIAEQPASPVMVAPAAQLSEEGTAFADPRKALPLGDTLDPGRPIRWLSGRTLQSGQSVLVPFDRVAVNGDSPDLPTICQNTNGLASGNTAAEATFHAVCELIERDANTLWSLRRPDERRARCLDPASFEDDLVDDLVARFERAGLAIRLFDQTTDLGVPTIFCVTAPADGIVVKHFDVAAGAGTHPNAARAALRAITEAAQTRVTSISGSRDDVRPDAYRLAGSMEALALLACKPSGAAPRSEVPVQSTAEALLGGVLAQLAGHGVSDLVAVSLGGGEYGISVVHVLSELLEDRGPNLHWKPGKRALDAVLGR